MPCLVDPEAARDTLESALRSGAPARAELTLAAVTPEVVRYREGLRCTIAYELEYAASAPTVGPSGVVAKVYEGDEGRHTYAAMAALWNSPLRFSSTVRIAEPLAFLPELNMVLQERVPGDITLKDYLKQACADGVASGVAALTEFVRKSGRGLAELHSCGATVGPDVTWDDQVAALRTAVTELTTAMAGSRAAVEPLVRGLERAAAEMPAVPLVPTHRSFRPAQILLDGTDIAFLDFDGYCLAEPGLDLSLFRTTLVDLCLRALEDDDEVVESGVAARAAGAAGQSVRELPGRLRGGRAGEPRAARPLGRPDQRQGHRGLLAQGQVRAPRPADGIPAPAVAAGVGRGTGAFVALIACPLFECCQGSNRLKCGSGSGEDMPSLTTWPVTGMRCD